MLDSTDYKVMKVLKWVLIAADGHQRIRAKGH